jgi:hypothetical protein
VALLRRSASTERAHVEAAPRRADDDGLALLDVAALRDEPDPDPLVEQAADRLRAALTSLEARDEWGRALAWRQVARIALGPLVTELRDSQTAARLLAATRPAPTTEPPAEAEVDIFDGDDSAAPTATLPTPTEMPFWPA